MVAGYSSEAGSAVKRRHLCGGGVNRPNRAMRFGATGLFRCPRARTAVPARTRPSACASTPGYPRAGALLPSRIHRGACAHPPGYPCEPMRTPSRGHSRALANPRRCLPVPIRVPARGYAGVLASLSGYPFAPIRVPVRTLADACSDPATYAFQPTGVLVRGRRATRPCHRDLHSTPRRGAPPANVSPRPPARGGIGSVGRRMAGFATEQGGNTMSQNHVSAHLTDAQWAQIDAAIAKV